MREVYGYIGYYTIYVDAFAPPGRISVASSTREIVISSPKDIGTPSLLTFIAKAEEAAGV